MKQLLLEVLRCPQTGQSLHFEGGHDHKHTDDPARYIEEGWLVSADGLKRYPIRGGIPRFVPETNYADNFGMQWNLFSKTQLDSNSMHPISADRFWTATGWRAEELAGKWVLDVGCGAGRFAEVALSSGAHVVALDYSVAVDARYLNLKHHPHLHVVQADVYALPFASESFPFVYSLGVLQHTPDVARAFAALSRAVEKGGLLCVDYYEKSWKSYMLPKYWLRPLTKRIPNDRLFDILQGLVPLLLPLSRALGRIPLVGRALRRIVPVANYEGILPLTETQLQEWALLDTFDSLSPAHDHPQTATTARMWMEKAGLRDIEVLRVGHLVARGRKC